MANPAAGVFKRLAYKFESTYGTAAGAAGAQYLRRVQSTLDMNKDTYESNEIRPDLQTADFRHGVRRPSGQFTGEMSAGTYKDFFAMVLKRDFAAITALTAVSLTVAGTGPTYTVTRSAGDWLAGGIKAGMVVRLSVGTLHANNINKNLLIISATTTVLTVLVLNGTAMQAEGPITGCTITVIGKTTFVPTTGHTDKSMSIEHYFSDLTQSELFLGCKVSKMSLGLPPTGMATLGMDIIAQDMTPAAAAYFTTPTAVTTSTVLAAVNGALCIGGTRVATLTGLTLDIMAKYDGDPVVGSNTIPFQFPGRVMVQGNATAYFDSITLRDAFLNETETSLIGAFSASNSATADFMAFTCPRLKLGGAAKDDGDKGLIQTIPFRALLQTAGGSGTQDEATTFMVQDSLA